MLTLIIHYITRISHGERGQVDVALAVRAVSWSIDEATTVFGAGASPAHAEAKRRCGMRQPSGSYTGAASMMHSGSAHRPSRVQFWPLYGGIMADAPMPSPRSACSRLAALITYVRNSRPLAVGHLAFMLSHAALRSAPVAPDCQAVASSGTCPSSSRRAQGPATTSTCFASSSLSCDTERIVRAKYWYVLGTGQPRRWYASASAS